MQHLKIASGECRKYPPKSVLALVNFGEGFTFDREIMNAFKKDQGPEGGGPYIKKAAIIGVKGLIKNIYNFVVGFSNDSYHAFDSQQEALEWLVRD